MTTKPIINSLTGLRGVAAMLVVVHHYFYWCAPFALVPRPDWLDGIFATDRLGMTCFFTLSGFVIAYNYLDFGWTRRPLRSTVHFLFLRFSRLYPALLLFIGMIVMMRWTSPTYANGFSTWTVLHLLSVESWLPMKLNGAAPDSNIFNVSWSISTEFMLYLVFALCMLLAAVFTRVGGAFGRWALGVLIGAYLVGVIALAQMPALFEELKSIIPVPLEPLTDAEWKRWFFYISPYFRLVEFALGGGAALVVMKYKEALHASRRTFRFLAAAAVAGLLFYYGVAIVPNDLQPGRVFYLLAPSICFALILLNCEDDSRVNRALSTGPLLFVGEISYSLYLFHPLSPRIGIVWPDQVFDMSMLPILILNMSVTILCALAFAYGTYRLVEMPSQGALRRLWTRVVGSSRERRGLPTYSALTPAAQRANS